MQKLHLFDFDGTITSKDTLFDFLKFASQHSTEIPSFRLGFLLFLPLFVLAKVGILDKSTTKEKFIAYFLKGKSKHLLEELAKKYAHSPTLPYREKALAHIKSLQQQPENTLYMVSASLDIWLKPIATSLGLRLICTHAAYKDEKYTGKFKGKNCNYQQKKVRIQEEIDLANFDETHAYGDSKGDSAMFSIVHQSHFRPFE